MRREVGVGDRLELVEERAAGERLARRGACAVGDLEVDLGILVRPDRRRHAREHARDRVLARSVGPELGDERPRRGVAVGLEGRVGGGVPGVERLARPRQALRLRSRVEGRLELELAPRRGRDVAGEALA